MLAIVCCVIFISLSSLGNHSTGLVEATIPVFVPILFALIVPVVQSTNVMVMKVASTVHKAPGRDFTFAFYLVSSGVTFVIAISYFFTHEGSFDFYSFVVGVIGSTCQIIGVLCMNLAISTGKASGPIMAIVSCQMLLLTVASSLINHLVPNLL